MVRRDQPKSMNKRGQIGVEVRLLGEVGRGLGPSLPDKETRGASLSHEEQFILVVAR